MLWYWIGLVLLVLLGLVLLAAFICCRLAFWVQRTDGDPFAFPRGSQYAPYRAEARQLVEDALAVPYRDVWTQSPDGLQLHGKFYDAAPDAPIMLMLHGYKSTAERDFCGGLREARAAGFRVLLADQRAHGRSAGKYLTFGIREREDCRAWVQYLLQAYGPETIILLYGISMGAATVLMAAGPSLPPQVVGIIADCGYTSPRAIIEKVLRQMHYPVQPLYWLIRLGGRLFGGFDLEEDSALAAMDRCQTPVLLFHGSGDKFVPCQMSRDLYARCRAPVKRLCVIPKAGHGISYLMDKSAYLAALSEFLQAIGLGPLPGSAD